MQKQLVAVAHHLVLMMKMIIKINHQGVEAENKFHLATPCLVQSIRFNNYLSSYMNKILT